MSFIKKRTGKRGEDLALFYLKKQGYKIIERNYRTRLGEIDIIGNDKDYICFIEVRSGNIEEWGSPEDSINRRKQHQITKTALSYIKRYGLENKSSRFDVIGIKDVNGASPKISLIKNAFELDNRYSY